MGVGNFAPVEGMGGATAGIWTTAGVELSYTNVSASTGPLAVGTYRVAATAAPCRVRQGGSGVVAVVTDALLNVTNCQVLRVSGAGDNYLAAIRYGAVSGVLNIERLDP